MSGEKTDESDQAGRVTLSDNLLGLHMCAGESITVPCGVVVRGTF